MRSLHRRVSGLLARNDSGSGGRAGRGPGAAGSPSRASHSGLWTYVQIKLSHNNRVPLGKRKYRNGYDIHTCLTPSRTIVTPCPGKG